MITPSDSFSTYDIGRYYVILPLAGNWEVDDYIKAFNAKKVKEGFHYNSGTNAEWLSVEDLRNLIQQHVDPAFKIEKKYESDTVR
jgi:UDP-N-acetylglucosamine 4,6-dehydratase/5-epimerase